MALQIITVVLFTVFFSEALTLRCYNCNTPNPTCTQTANCMANSQCSSVTAYNSSNILVNEKKCADSASCVNSGISLGWAGMSSQCCSSDLCNGASGNGLECHICNVSDKECLKTQKINCTGVEDRCITTKVGSGATYYTWKGCASLNICDNITQLNSTLISLTSALYSNSTVLSVSCCTGNLCNNMTHLRPDLGGFLLILLAFGCSVLSM